MPAEMTLFSAMQKKLLDTQAELDQACGTRYAESRATLLSLITDDLPRFQLYTETVANLFLDIGAQQATLRQKIQMRAQQQPSLVQASAPLDQNISIEVANSNISQMPSELPGQPSPTAKQTKATQTKARQPKAPANKSIWTTLAFIGSAFSKDPATTLSAYSDSDRSLNLKGK